MNNVSLNYETKATKAEQWRPIVEVNAAMEMLEVDSAAGLWKAMAHCKERALTLRKTGVGTVERIVFLRDVIERFVPVWRKIQNKRKYSRLRRSFKVEGA